MHRATAIILFAARDAGQNGGINALCNSPRTDNHPEVFAGLNIIYTLNLSEQGEKMKDIFRLVSYENCFFWALGNI